MAPSGVDSSTYTALVTGGSRLSEGALIRATVRVRVFGLNLVRLEANIEAAPAQLKKLARLLPPLNAPYAPTPAARSLEEPEPHAERGPQSPPRPPRLVGSRLDEAQHLLDEGAASLAAAGELRSPAPRRA